MRPAAAELRERRGREPAGQRAQQRSVASRRRLWERATENQRQQIPAERGNQQQSSIATASTRADGWRLQGWRNLAAEAAVWFDDVLVGRVLNHKSITSAVPFT